MIVTCIIVCGAFFFHSVSATLLMVHAQVFLLMKPCVLKLQLNCANSFSISFSPSFLLFIIMSCVCLIFAKIIIKSKHFLTLNNFVWFCSSHQVILIAANVCRTSAGGEAQEELVAGAG